MENLRPSLLTALCILTFIFSGYSIFKSVSEFVSAEETVGLTKDVMDDALDKAEEGVKSEKEAKMLESIVGSITKGISVENMKNNALATGISCLLTLLGAILMWGLNKKGFYLYIIGSLISIFGPIFIFQGFIGMAAGGFTAFFSVLFCVLYGLNLKHMS